MTYSGTPDWLVVANPSDAARIQEALKHLTPGSLLSENASEVFPRDKRVGECRICGKHGPLTREHTPPRGAFNKLTGRSPSIVDWLEADQLELPEAGPTLQGGIWGYTLCESCNHLSGRYGHEYRIWAEGAANVIRETIREAAPNDLDQTDGYLNDLNQIDGYLSRGLGLEEVFPARFARQALAQVLVASGSAQLSARVHVLERLALDGPPAALPNGMHLFLALYLGPIVRILGGPTGQTIVPLSGGGPTRVIEVAYPPFAVQFILEGDPSRAAGVDISNFLEMDPNQKATFTIEDLALGFGNTPYPLDYRSIAQIAREARPNNQGRSQ